MKVALAQVNTTVGDFPGNLEKARAALARARDLGVDLVVFPEQTLPGYPAEDLLEREDFLEAAEHALTDLVAASSGLGLVVGTLTRATSGDGNPIYNSAVLIDDGQIVGAQHKTLLPTYDVFDEGRYFRGAASQEVFDFRGVKLGIGICEDFWNDPLFWARRRYTVDPIETLAAKGAQLLVGIAASPFSIGRGAFRREMIEATVRRIEIPVVYTNLVGGNTTLVFDGASFALDASGNVLAEAVSFEEAFVVLEVDPSDRSAPASRREATIPSADAAPREAEGMGTGQSAGDTEAEQVYRALVLGTHDYLHKSGFQRAVVGLSGGIDSALTAAIAVSAVGKESVVGVAMPSRYSSAGSRRDAEVLAQNLGIELHVISIEAIFQSALESLAPVFGDRDADVTEENLQARARGMVLMALSNKFNALLLTTGNKSELAVGYCTLYGDMSGGLAVISDVPKSLVYRVARWLNRDREVIPQNTIDKPPSAELSPGQKDEDSLPPYDILDAILEGYVELGEGVPQLVARGYDPEVVADVVGMVDRNEYKRKQAAPGLRITTKAFGPGRRFPIVQRFRRRG